VHLAEKLVNEHKLAQRSDEQNPSSVNDDKSLLIVDLNKAAASASRSLGPELACRHAWMLLGFEGILKDCGFDPADRALAGAVMFGRLISPGSELHAIKWLKKMSSLPEFPGADITYAGKDKFYEIGDKLYAQKNKLEEKLFYKGIELTCLQMKHFFFMILQILIWRAAA
jgi:hypothetical protein